MPNARWRHDETAIIHPYSPCQTDGAFGEDETLQREFKEIVKAEIETAKSLFKGNAIMEHMENSYCEMVAVRLGLTFWAWL